MSFGTSVGDIVALIQLAHRNYRNCKQAGGEYLEIAREVRSLHSVLKSLQDEADNKESLLFQKDAPSKSQLSGTIEGCKGILEGIDALLVKYHGLAPDNAETSKSKKLWHRMRFGAELDELGKFRWKIITYTSTLAVLLDSVHLKATDRVEKIAGRVESQVESGFAEVLDRLEGFEDMRRAVLYIATKARSSQRFNAMESVLSLSTYADDDKEVWRQFRSQLVSLGFRSDSLDRHMEVLKAYMMRLDQTGVLDDAVARTSTSHQPWCRNASFRMTNLSLLGIIENDPSPINSAEAKPPDPETQSLQKDITSWQAAVDKQDSPNSPDAATNEAEQEILPLLANKIPPAIVVHESLTDGSIKANQSSTGIDTIPALAPSVSPSGRRRVSRSPLEEGNELGYPRRTYIDTISSGIRPSSSTSGRTPGTDDPPPYSESNTIVGSTPSQASGATRNRAADFPFGPDESHPISDVNNRPNIEPERSSSVNESNMGSSSRPRPPFPYAESYYSATEAASSQSTLIAPVTDSVESNSNLRVHRPQNRVRPSSWDGSDSRVPDVLDVPRQTQFQRQGPHDPTFVDRADKKAGNESSYTGKSPHMPQEKGEGAERWLRWAENLPDKPAKVRWAEESPIRRQTSTRSNDDRKSRGSYGDRGSKHRRASSEDDYSPERLKPNNRSVRSGNDDNLQRLATAALLAQAAQTNYRASGSDYWRPRKKDDYSPERLKPRNSRLRGDSDPKASSASSKWQQAAKAALLAGATEAFRVRNEPGGWGEVKGKRVLTAAIGAAGVDAAADRDPDGKSKRNILESVVGGLAANRVINERRGRTRFRGSVVSEESDLGSSDSDDDRRRRPSPSVSYGSKPILTRSK